MSDGVDEELARLRRRAYAPDADIVDDPAAVERLQQLEALRSDRTRATDAASRRPPVPSRAQPSASEPAQPGAPAQDAVAPPLLAASSTATADPVVAGQSPEGAKVGLARVLGVAAVAACVAAALSAVVTFATVSAGDQPYAVLHETDDPATFGYFDSTSEPQRYEDFMGVRVTVGKVDVFGTCMVIEFGPVDSTDYASSTTRGNCAAPGFEPLVDVPVALVTFDSDDREALGDASGLRFELVGDEVRVYVARVTQDLSGS